MFQGMLLREVASMCCPRFCNLDLVCGPQHLVILHCTALLSLYQVLWTLGLQQVGMKL
jgi:hypothetical protein